MEHLNLDRIHSYIEKQETGKNLSEIEGHLASCEKCHSVYIELLSVEHPLSGSFMEEEGSASCPEDWDIGALIQDELPPAEAEKISSHFQECHFCLERAVVYYQSMKLEKAPVEAPDSWKHKAIHALRAGKTIREPHVSFIQRIVDFFSDLTVPLPAAAGYAAALLAVAVLVWMFMPGQTRFITIASSEKVMVRDSEIPSAFGFSGTGETKEVKMMNLSLKGNDILFTWEPLEGVAEYSFSLREGDHIIHDMIAVQEPRVSLSKDNIEKERIYSWLITGKTKEGRYLEYTGDFILAQ